MEKYPPLKPGQIYSTPKYPAPPPRFKLEPSYIILPMSGSNLGSLIFILTVAFYMLFN